MDFKVEMTAKADSRHNLYELLAILLMSIPNERLLDAMVDNASVEVIDILIEEKRMARELHNSLTITPIKE